MQRSEDSQETRKSGSGGGCCQTHAQRNDPPGITQATADDRRPAMQKITVDAMVRHPCGIRDTLIFPKKVTVVGGVDVFNGILDANLQLISVSVTPTSPCDPGGPSFAVQYTFDIAGLYNAGDTAAFEIVGVSCCSVSNDPGIHTNQIAI